MVNVQLKHQAFCVLVSMQAFTIGPNENRTTVITKLYRKNPEKQLEFISEGVAILNPVDKFNSRIGIHKALESATAGLPFTLEEKRAFHAFADQWNG